MMNCFSLSASAEDKEMMRRSHEIDQQLAAEKSRALQRLNLLLLGPSECGKSTVLKQIRLSYNQNVLTEKEVVEIKSIINTNILQICQQIVAGREVTQIPWENSSTEKFAGVIKEFPLHSVAKDLDPKIKESILELWRDSSVPKILKRCTEYELLDSVSYWFPEEMNRVFSDNYLPTTKDILQSRVKTTVITDYEFTVGKAATLVVTDVAGHRSFRNKWLQVFAGVSSVIYIAAANSYYQRLTEDRTMLRINDSLALFDSIVNNKTLQNCPFIFFLNKIDLIVKNINDHPLNEAFPEYKGTDHAQACKFLLKKFLNLNNNKSRTIYSHFTHATDTRQFQKVLADVIKIILKGDLQAMHLMGNNNGNSGSNGSGSNVRGSVKPNNTLKHLAAAGEMKRSQSSPIDQPF